MHCRLVVLLGESVDETMVSRYLKHFRCEHNKLHKTDIIDIKCLQPKSPWK
jgi:hypothetical protein